MSRLSPHTGCQVSSTESVSGSASQSEEGSETPGSGEDTSTASSAEPSGTEATGAIEEEEDAESMYFISTLPWLHYTALIQPVAGGDESNPRITWGRYEEKADGTILMPVSILVHHALADGLQIAAFYQNLEQQIRLFAEG